MFTEKEKGFQIIQWDFVRLVPYRTEKLAVASRLLASWLICLTAAELKARITTCEQTEAGDSIFKSLILLEILFDLSASTI